MFRESRLTTLIVPLVALAAILNLACPSAEAKTKHFKIFGVGAGPEGLPLPGQPARPHWVVGHATTWHTYGSGTVTDSAGGPDENGRITGEFGSGSPFVFVGANRDRLACQYGRTEFGAEEPGYFELTIVAVLDDGSLVVEALWIAEFVVQPELCAGKFADVTGSWIMYAQSEPFVLGSDDPVYYSWEGEGELEFGRGND